MLNQTYLDVAVKGIFVEINLEIGFLKWCPVVKNLAANKGDVET